MRGTSALATFDDQQHQPRVLTEQLQPPSLVRTVNS
jgi:hypothetical protein